MKISPLQVGRIEVGAYIPPYMKKENWKEKKLYDYVMEKAWNRHMNGDCAYDIEFSSSELIRDGIYNDAESAMQGFLKLTDALHAMSIDWANGRDFGIERVIFHSGYRKLKSEDDTEEISFIIKIDDKIWVIDKILKLQEEIEHI